MGPGVAAGAAPASDKDEGSPRGISGLNHTAFDLAVYASRGGHPPPRKTRFRLLARLYRTGLVTRRVPDERFQAVDISSP